MKRKGKVLLAVCCMISVTFQNCYAAAMGMENYGSPVAQEVSGAEEQVYDAADAVELEDTSAETDLKVVEENPEMADLTEAIEAETDIRQYESEVVGTASAIDRDKITQSTWYDKIIFSTENNGIYFLKTVGEVYGNYQSYEVVFYDLDTKSCETVYSYTRSEAVYSDANAVYFAKYRLTELPETVTVGDIAYNYSCAVTLTKYDFVSAQVTEISLDAFYCTLNWAGYLNALGVDGRGRIYVVTQDKELHLFGTDGTHLSQTTFTGSIDSFYGFDDTNGNFYYQGTYNWIYWGYDHYMASMMAGNVNSSNEINMPEQNLSILYQLGFYTHAQPVTMLNGKYLALLSTFSSGTLMLLNSNAYQYTDYTQQSTSIAVIDSSVSVSMLNVSDTNIISLAAATANAEYSDNLDISSVGPRCALTADEQNLIVKTDKCVLTEYEIAGQKKVMDAVTQYPVYTFAMYGDTCVAVERDGDNYYIEELDWSYPSDFTVSAPSSMTVGESGSLVCGTDSAFMLDYTFESSAPTVVSIDGDGQLLAWAEGTAVITVRSPSINISKQVTITVSDSAASAGDYYKITKTTGTASGNMHAPQNTGYYGNVTEAYLTQRSGGGYERVEYIGSQVVIETYNSEYSMSSKKTLSCELPLFGGYYSGGNYNFLVFGKENKTESDSAEVIRIVKYDKSWNRLGACSVKGANTRVPFDAGGLSMAEQNGILYVHTCHTMYQSDDGYNHQANCTFCVQESNMTLKDSYTDVMNIAYGYVSHSFMQYVRTDDTYVYRVDLGDAYPRGIAYTATKHTDAINEPSFYGNVMSIPGSAGYNYTGYALSGLEVSDKYCVITGCGVESMNSKNRNVWVCTVRKSDGAISKNWITEFTDSSNVSAQQPRLVKLNSNQFLLMWEEYSSQNDTYTTKMALLNPNGELASKIYNAPLALSSCNPIVNADGQVVWYVTNGSSPVFVTINPFQLAKVQEKSKNVSIFTIDNTDNWKPEATNKNVTRKKIKYKLTNSGTATAIGTTVKSIKSITIPATIKVDGVKYKVTVIGKNAFRGLKSLKKLTLGKNIKKIKKSAFYRCKSLKRITIKTKNLTVKKVGAKAFKGINNKAVIKVPARKLKTYKKILKKKGITGKKQKIKKI